MTTDRCTECYGTGDATAYIDQFNGRAVIHTISGEYRPCTKCTVAVDIPTLITCVQQLIQAQYVTGILYAQTVEQVEQVKADIRNIIQTIEKQAHIVLDTSFIEE